MEKRSRLLDQTIKMHFKRHRHQILMLLGPRQSGKTTLISRLFPRAQYFLVDNEPILKNLETYDINIYKQIIHPRVQTLVIDEIHLLSNPGRCAKIIHDQLPRLQLIITGSSSLHIKNKTGESLAGRKIDYHLYPLTFSEYLFQKSISKGFSTALVERILKRKLKHHPSLFDLKVTLENFLLFGGYPYLIDNPNDKAYLKNLVESAVFKDILDLDLIENRRDGLNLLKLLAYQMGNLINYSEISLRLGIDARTIRRYIDIFEQSFILFRLYPYSKNRRNEIVKTPKIYFYDTGLRNALIDDFSPLSLRPDLGALFENFIISEVHKDNSYLNLDLHLNYWRNKQGAEIDLVFSKRDLLTGIEIKYTKGSITRAFTNRYKKANVLFLNSDNFY
ncbi:ATP-binding protein [Candidatus Roizmanbacteria bacterium]|nr:ATP-binding protein [Candidatus Roizmanbacteria bacterium]